MARKYTHIKSYEKEIFEMKGNGLTNREIAESYGLQTKQIINLITRHNRRKEKINAGILIRRGRPPKDSIITEADKLTDLRYKLNRKDARIKQLEMENELMRDFLKETGRK